MSIEITTNEQAAPVQPSEQPDKASAEKPEQSVDTSSVRAQGENEKEAKPQDEVSEDNGEKEGDEPLAAEERPKKKSGTQRLKEKVARLSQELEALKTQGFQSQRKEEPKETLDTDSKEPLEENFETHKDYVKALAKWTYEQEKAQDQKRTLEVKERESYQAQIKAHNDRVAKFKETNPEYDDVVADFIEEHGDMRFSVGLEQALLESDLSPQVLLDLAQNPDELIRINSLSPIAAAREVGKIEARIASRDASKKVEAKTITKAPPPPNPISGTADSSAKKSIFDPDLPFEEYEALRREELKRQKRWA